MPTKRTRTPRALGRRITPQAVAAFLADDHLGLERALGLPPWAANPLDADGPTPPSGSTPGAWHDSWAEAWALREALEEASRAD
jgi:hypothetical protein